MSSIPNLDPLQAPEFDPFVLSPLDHSIGFLHLAPFLTFEAQDVNKCVSVIEAGLARCIELLPFLSGNVAPSNRLPGKENVLEVRPSTADFLQQHPMLTVRNHDAFVNPKNGTPVVNYDFINNESFISILPTMALEELSPVLRLQANVMRDGVIVCFCFHHMVMDGAGMVGVMKSIASCCKNPGATLDNLPTTPLQQEKSRKMILEAGAAPSSHSEITTGRGATVFDLQGEISSDFVSRIISLDTTKIKALQAASMEKLKSAHAGSEVSISRNAIVTSVLWMSFTRARHLLSAANGEKGPSESSAIMASEIRQKIQPGLPSSYFGNGVVGAHAYSPVEPILSATKESSHPISHSISPNLKEMDILAELALQIQKAFNSITAEFVQDYIRHIVTQNDWSLPPRVADVAVSSLRSFRLYELDFGPAFGPVQRFDMPETRIPGLAWIMPIRNGRTSDPWEVRLALERKMMEYFQEDRLIRWMSPGNESKL